MADDELGHEAMPFLVDFVDDDAILEIIVMIILICTMCVRKRKRWDYERRYSMLDQIPSQVKRLTRLVGVTNAHCIANLRMDRNTLGRLVLMLRELGGLRDGKYVSVEEQVVTFLEILAHHKKNRTVGFDYQRSGQTVSKYVNEVLQAILMLHGLLLAKPKHIPDDCTDPRWKWFKGCLGALDGTYISVKVSSVDKPRYRTRKGSISTNTLAVCDRMLRFIYVLPGWEGSAADSRVLRDAVTRSNGLKVPRGCYYLADSGYANSQGFLTPYRTVRYHLREWGPENMQPSNPHEMFNMQHSKTRNVIERAFGTMKMRWGILRSTSFYPVRTQIKLIGVCFLLHNFIRSNMEEDPIEQILDSEENSFTEQDIGDDVEFINNVQANNEWNAFRDGIASSMWNETLH